MKCFHHNDMDGRAAAAVVKRWAGFYPEHHLFRYIELDYKDTVDVDAIEDGELVVIVDFSFKPEVMARVLKRTPKVIWCDHHSTAKSYDYGRNLLGYRDFTDKAHSGCECAWLYFFPSEPLPRALFLIGDYDCWRLSERPACFEFYEGMKLIPHAPLDPVWDDLFHEGTGRPNDVDMIRSDGKTAIVYRDRYCSDFMRQFGYETEIDGVKAYAVNLYRYGSPGFVEKFAQYPVCIAYAHDGQRFTVSLYSETVDVSTICKNHDGGGHRGAAGFVCDVLPFQKRNGGVQP